MHARMTAPTARFASVPPGRGVALNTSSTPELGAPTATSVVVVFVVVVVLVVLVEAPVVVAVHDGPTKRPCLLQNSYGVKTLEIAGATNDKDAGAGSSGSFGV